MCCGGPRYASEQKYLLFHEPVYTQEYLTSRENMKTFYNEA